MARTIQIFPLSGNSVDVLSLLSFFLFAFVGTEEMY